MTDETLPLAVNAKISIVEHIRPGTEIAPGITFIGDSKTGIWSNIDGSIDFSTNSTKRLTINTTTVTPTLLLYNMNGTSVAPSLAFTSDPNTGFYSVGADQIGFAAGGTLRFSVASTSINTFAPITADPGSASAPPYTFTSDTNTGIFSNGANLINLTTGGTSCLQISTSAIIPPNLIYTNSGASATPAYAFSGDSDTGFYNFAANSLDFATSGVSRLRVLTTSIRPTNSLLAPAGSAGTLSYTFTGNMGTGIYSSATSTINLVIGGTSPVQLDTAAITSTLPIYAPNGSASAPGYSFSGSSNTGFHGNSGDAILFDCGGVNRGYFNANGFHMETVSTLFYLQDGTDTAPSFAFANDTDTGIYRSATDTINFTIGGVSSLQLNTASLTSAVPISSNGGSFSTPSYSFSSGKGYYLYNGTENEFVGTSGSGNGTDATMFRCSTVNGYTCVRTDGSNVRPTSMLKLAYSGASWTTESMFTVINHNAGSLAAWNFFRCNNSGGPAFRVRGDGATFADGAYSSAGADYAEYFESIDGKEIPIGSTVVLENGKIRRSTLVDLPNKIIGVIRPKNSSGIVTLGNSYEDYWQGKYEKTEFGANVMEAIDIYQWVDEKGHQETKHADEIPPGLILPDNKTVIASSKRKKSSLYDPNVAYIPRSQRPEWLIVGMLGQVPIKTGECLNPKWKLLGNIGNGTIARRYLIK